MILLTSTMETRGIQRAEDTRYRREDMGISGNDDTICLLLICLKQGKGRQEKEGPSMSAMEVTQDNTT